MAEQVRTGDHIFHPGVPQPPLVAARPGRCARPPPPSPWPDVQPQELFLPAANSPWQRGCSRDRGFVKPPDPRESPPAALGKLLGPSHRWAWLGEQRPRPVVTTPTSNPPSTRTLRWAGGAGRQALHLCSQFGSRDTGIQTPNLWQDPGAHSARGSPPHPPPDSHKACFPLLT